jgi:hypothetical protein
MNALVQKELRLIFPVWLLAMALAIIPVWISWPTAGEMLFVRSPGALIYAPFGIGVLLLGLTPFGQEISLGTFSMLLAQPVSRRRLWLVKTTILAVALFLVFVALCVSNSIRAAYVLEMLKVTSWQHALSEFKTKELILKAIAELHRTVIHDSLIIGGMSAFAAFAGGLWTNLLFRNTSAAFWFTLLIPLGLGLLAEKLFGSIAGVNDVGLIVLLGIYSIAGFLWARKYFLQVQDTQWTGGVISFSTWFGSDKASDESANSRGRKPFRALLRKEFQFQQINLLIAGLLLISHLIVIIVRRVSADYFLAHHSAAMIWESWPILWLAMPLLIGGAAIAEERKLGTLESFLCLPVTRRREFLVKFGMTIVLGVFLGGVMPVLVEWLGAAIGVPRTATGLGAHLQIVSLLSSLTVGSAVLVVLAFYASTLTRNLLQSLGLAVMLAVIAFVLVQLVFAGGRVPFGFIPLWSADLAAVILIPVMAIAIVLLAFINYRIFETSFRVWRRNTFVLLLSLVCSGAATTVIYHRVWELWMPVEPAHVYRSVYHGLGLTAGFDATLSRMTVALPDGRLWMRQGRLEHIPVKDIQNEIHWQTRAAGPWHSGFLEGTNWRDIAVADQGCFAIRLDGTLWDLSDVQPGNSGAADPRRVGESSDWSKISAGRNHFSALKNDGTLWQWGEFDSTTNFSPTIIPTPTQIGADKDWIAISEFNFGDAAVAVKSDGTIWRYGKTYVQNSKGSWIRRTPAQPEFWMPGPDKKPLSVSYDKGAVVIVYRDGTSWMGVNGDNGSGLLDRNLMELATERMVQLGSGSDWLNIKLFQWGQAVGIKRDHSLWVWDRHWVSGHTVAWPVSAYSDWIAIAPYRNGFLALATDGKLCLWNPENFGLFNYGFAYNSWLMPSRIKAKVIADLR